MPWAGVSQRAVDSSFSVPAMCSRLNIRPASAASRMCCSGISRSTGQDARGAQERRHSVTMDQRFDAEGDPAFDADTISVGFGRSVGSGVT